MGHDLLSLSLLLFVLLGGLAGCLSGLLGIGGGVILVPALVFVFGMSQHMAQGTTLALMVPPIGLLAAWTYYRQGHVHLRIAVQVCIGFAIGGLLGAHLALWLSNIVLERVFGISLVLIALKVLLGEYQGVKPRNCGRFHDVISLKSVLVFVSLGLLAGAASGLVGIGGGIILVPAFTIFFGLCQHEAQGTTLALMVPPIGILAATQYYQHGDVHLGVAAMICVGFFVGGFLGAKLATRLPSHLLAKVFGISMLLIAAKMIFAF